MLSIAIIIFREVLEIAIIIGVLLAATRGVASRERWVWGGVAAGAAGAVIVAYFAGVISNFAQGMGQELFNATVLFLAAFLIGWTVVWMRRHGRELTQHFKQIGIEVAQGRRSYSALSIAIALAVLREGSEIALFTYGVAASGEDWVNLFTGGAVGFAAGAAVGATIYFGLLKIPTKQLFSVTSWLLVFLAAGMVSQALGFLAAAGFVPEILYPVWDSSKILSQQSILGQILHALAGYTERPSGIQLIGYLTTLGSMGMILKWFGQDTSSIKKTALVWLAAFLTGSSIFSGNAWATNKVYSPIVHQGELELEARGSYDFDKDDEKDGAQKQRVAIGYGVTDRWFTEFYGNYEKEAGKDFEFESVEWENILLLFEQGKYPWDSGLYFAYEFADDSDAADEIEGKLLLEKESGRLVHTANLVLKKEVGSEAEKGIDGGLAWGTRLRWQKALEPGVELYWFDQGDSRLGPALSGQLGDHVKYNVGYLFGLSDAPADGRLKWMLEFEWRF